MLKRIKGFYNLTDDVEQLNVSFRTFQQLMSEISIQFKTELAELKELKNYQMEYLENYKKNVAEIEQIKENLRKEVDDFQALKLQTQKSILDKFERELRANFLKYNDELKIDKDKYNKIKDKVDATIQNIFMLNAEIGKLTEVSKKIKSSDFDLVKIHQNMVQEDRNKLELMKKVDELERLLARMKRGEARVKY